MEILEYQAKELFRGVGIPILPSQTIKDARKIKQLQIPYPVVLKSQVRSGGRGKAGGVRFVANTIDAIAGARTIFNLPILGEYPEVILVEAHYHTEREFFLAVVLDYELQCPVLLGSAYGGMNAESLLANLQQVVVDREFSLFYARRLAANMGLSGKLIQSVSDIIEKMYYLFNKKDLDLIEINPLGVNSKGELMALDGKITINDYALARHPLIEALNMPETPSKLDNQYYGEKANKQHNPSWRWHWKEEKGKIAIICNSCDLALLTWDLIAQKKIKPACAIVIENSENSCASELNDVTVYVEQLRQILIELQSVQELKAILVNIWDTEAMSSEIVQAIANYCKASYELLVKSTTSETTVVSDLVNNDSTSNSISRTTSGEKLAGLPVSPVPQVQFVLRLINKANFENLKIPETMYLTNSLEDAVSQTITVVKSR
jgi:succinyl-CoA synthetase beta subunit